jgi:phosphinothricin acetyltransferase
VDVRDARAGDTGAIAALFNALILTTTVGWREHLTTPAEQLEWLHEREERGFPTLVADESGEVVGYCCWTSFRGGDRFPGYRHTVEHTVHVRGDRHGQGIGRLLLGALVHRAAAGGIHVMVAGIDADNAASIAFHASMGFVEVARMPETGRKFGRWLELVLMQRIIPG